MRDIPQGLAQHLAGEATTLAHCWRVTRADGQVLGFTDHDRDLNYDGVTHEAASGLDASEVEAELGFATAGGEVAGALMSARISADDLAAGRYDGAEVVTDLVNWANPSQRLTLSRMLIGEVRRGTSGFTAELRSPAVAFEAEHGRLYTRDCSADLGDTHCGVAILPVMTSILASDGRLVLRVTLGANDGDYTRGTLRFTGGPNAGIVHSIRLHRQQGSVAELMLWQAVTHPVTVGDAVELRPGCDKSFETCRQRFGNGARFRGFPHMPGNDFILGGVAPGSAMDGRSLFR